MNILPLAQKRGHIDGELSVQDFFTNEMNIELKMFCTSMKYRIVGKGDRTLVITPHYWRMWWRKMELLK